MALRAAVGCGNGRGLISALAVLALLALLALLAVLVVAAGLVLTV